jgi:hypothetical protein
MTARARPTLSGDQAHCRRCRRTWPDPAGFDAHTCRPDRQATLDLDLASAGAP